MITQEQLKDVLERADALHRYLEIDKKKIEFVVNTCTHRGIQPLSVLFTENHATTPSLSACRMS